MSRISGLVDSHCHLQLLDPAECRRVLDRARERGVDRFLVPAISLDDAERLLVLAAEEPGVSCAVGVHPHEASRWQEGDGRRLEALLEEPEVVAVGECGLDFHYDRSPRDQQMRVMRAQWEIAVDRDLPVIVHNRESNMAMLETVREPRFSKLEGVFHSFAGGLSMARELLERGFTLGFSGMVTFNAADNVREVLPETPLSHMLIETDAPYLAPVPYRGKPNEPGFVVEIAQRIAAELDLAVSELSERTTGNFLALFPDRRSGRS